MPFFKKTSTAAKSLNTNWGMCEKKNQVRKSQAGCAAECDLDPCNMGKSQAGCAAECDLDPCNAVASAKENI
ncbi:hypothetical protein EYZ11_012933 [Aspergillus tanneri]|uniref:Uncharacterized protein n=1 Tax=Aspergillus tanneri TaxID=1220188 RepID=A0A4S3IYY4_9EURO|nr:hypothetical protein EYZ11_012933 [Aspergillus tanneri]